MLKHEASNPLVINILCVTYFCDFINSARPQSNDMRRMQ